MSDPIIVHDAGKRFRHYHPDRPRRLKEILVRGVRWLKPIDHFWALRHIDLKVTPGRMVGIIGPNGSGKSTLLRLIGDVLRPDEGYVKTRGRIGALLDLGANFHPDLTGRENVFVSGLVAGLTRQEVAARFDAIVAFAELEEFIDSPLRTYSTGMRMRLAFAVDAHTDPEILLIDEVLAVGDLAFRVKCFERIDQFKAEGCTILLVSHDSGQIQQLCDEVIWLRHGQLAAQGSPEEVIGQYVDEMTAETRRRSLTTSSDNHTSTNANLRMNENRFGSQEIAITAVRLLDRNGLPVVELNSGDALRVEIEFHAPEPVAPPIFGVAIGHANREICCSTNTVMAELSLPPLHGSGRISVHFDRLDLMGGHYYVNVGVYEGNWAYAYDYHLNVYSLVIRPTGGQKGVLFPPHYWQMEEAPVLEALPVTETP